MLLGCCLMHVGIIMLGHFLCLLYLCPCLGLRSFAGWGFRVAWAVLVWRVAFLFLGGFLLVLGKFSFWPGNWALGCHSMGFGRFPDIF